MNQKLLCLFLLLTTMSILITGYAQDNLQKKRKNPGLKTIANIELQSPSLKLAIPISKVVGADDPNNEFYFDGVRDCASGNPTGMQGLQISHTGQCLAFHTGFSAEPWSLVPVQRMGLINTQSMKDDLNNIYKTTGITVAQGETRKYKWGAVYNWNTETTGSAHYMYLSVPKKGLTIRLGPIAGSELRFYEFGFGSAEWK